MTKEQILQDALEQFEARTGVHAVVTAPDTSDTDGVFRFTFEGMPQQAYMVVKRYVQPAQMFDLLRLKERYDHLLVASEYIYPKLKDELRLAGVAYLETNGNVYFKGRGMLLWIDRQSRGMTPMKSGITGRAFTRTGLRLVFHFLLDPGLLDLTYREIAKRTGVVFGNINVVVNDLKQQGFLVELEKNRFVLNNRAELLKRWMEGYEEKLKPALKVGNFRFLGTEDILQWKEIPLQPMKTYWGAEPAAELLTNYLKPGKWTLYTLETRQELISNYRLVPDEEGPVEVFRKFWQTQEAIDRVVPPLLVYADLINTGERRCMESAQKVYERYLQH